MADADRRNRFRPAAVPTTMTIRAALLLVLVLLGAGCAAASTDPSPTPPPLPVPVTTPEQAVARVILAEPRLTGIAPRNPDAIGQASLVRGGARLGRRRVRGDRPDRLGRLPGGLHRPTRLALRGRARWRGVDRVRGGRGRP